MSACRERRRNAVGHERRVPVRGRIRRGDVTELGVARQAGHEGERQRAVGPHHELPRLEPSCGALLRAARQHADDLSPPYPPRRRATESTRGLPPPMRTPWPCRTRPKYAAPSATAVAGDRLTSTRGVQAGSAASNQLASTLWTRPPQLVGREESPVEEDDVGAHGCVLISPQERRQMPRDARIGRVRQPKFAKPRPTTHVGRRRGRHDRQESVHRQLQAPPRASASSSGRRPRPTVPTRAP